MLKINPILAVIKTTVLLGSVSFAHAVPVTVVSSNPVASVQVTAVQNGQIATPNSLSLPSPMPPMDDISDDDEVDDGEEIVTTPIPTNTANTNLPVSNNLLNHSTTNQAASSIANPTATPNTTTRTNPSTTINPDILRMADNVPPSIEQVPLGTISPITIQKFVKLIDTVRQEYVRPVNDEQLFDNAMTGVLTGLDPYSEYLNPEAYNNLRLFTEGDMGSIGVKAKFDPTSQQWVFIEVLPNSPANKAGIKVGDYLHQINDIKLLDNQTQQDIDQLLSGIAGTQVKLIVSNQGRRKHSVMLQRSLLQQQPIQAKIVNDVAVVHIPIFQSNTAQQMIDSLTRLNQPFSAMIIDVRNNPGGVLTAATDIASLFMQDKNVVQVHGRDGLQEIVKTRAGTPRLATIPLVILQNRYSASASEVLASSLQENGRAKIFGETSYGKGSIQSVLALMSNDAVKLTVAHYYSGLGKKIDGVGVIPDEHLQGGELTWEQQVLNSLLIQSHTTRYVLQNPK